MKLLESLCPIPLTHGNTNLNSFLSALKVNLSYNFCNTPPPPLEEVPTKGFSL